MAKIAKASEHIKPCNIAQSERHNRRDADYIASLNPAMLYIRKDLAHLNDVYVAPDMEGVSLQQHLDEIRVMVKQKTGRAMQEKDVEFTDKKGKKRVRQGCSPIREGVVNIKPDTTMDDLLRYVQKVNERWGIRALQIHIHKDEGHYEQVEDPSSWEPNLHAHIIWDWMDHTTGKSFKLNAEDMSAMQDMVAETLAMERGQKKTETGVDHLERNDFIIQKQEDKKRRLQEETSKAIAEKEEAEEKAVEAKEAITAMRQERQQLIEGNRTKTSQKLQLDREIRSKQERSQSLDADITEKSDKVSELDKKEREKVRALYQLDHQGDWENSMLLSLSTYAARTADGLLFCVKAIQDFAYSGFGCRGGKHGDIFWDNESTAIKSFMVGFAEITAATLEHIASWLVWLADKLGKFNDYELRRADHEVHDIADGRYDRRIQKYQQGLSR